MKTNQKHKQGLLLENELFQAISLLKTPEEVKAFFKDLCTPAEIQAMADRFGVVKYILQSLPYREINEKTGVSTTTIGRVARCLQFGAGGYSVAYERMYQRK